MFFQYDHIAEILEKSRGWIGEITVEKKDGTTRTLQGYICKHNERNNYLVNEGDEMEPDFKQINMFKVLEVKINGLIYRPRSVK